MRRLCERASTPRHPRPRGRLAACLGLLAAGLVVALSLPTLTGGQDTGPSGHVVYADEECGWIAMLTAQGYTLARVYGAAVGEGDALAWEIEDYGLTEATILGSDLNVSLWIEGFGLSAEEVTGHLHATGCPIEERGPAAQPASDRRREAR